MLLLASVRESMCESLVQVGRGLKNVFMPNINREVHF